MAAALFGRAADIPALFWLTPLWFVFEVVQLVLAERYLGLKQMARGADPRETGPGEAVAFCWVTAIVLYWAWMLGMVMVMNGLGRLAALCILLISVLGAMLRRLLGLKLCLVVLTFEGACRIGMFIYLSGLLWHRR